MAYRYGNREQIELFPSSIEDYVSQEHPVRAYDAFVEALDLNELGITLDDHKVGNSEYYPKTMLKLLIYGYSYGFRSSRKLERAILENLSFIWLSGGLKPELSITNGINKNFSRSEYQLAAANSSSNENKKDSAEDEIDIQSSKKKKTESIERTLIKRCERVCHHTKNGFIHGDSS